MEAVNWAKHHPVPAVVGGIVLLYLVFHFLGGGGSSSNGASADAAYYAAQAAQTQAGDAVQIAQINAQATTAQTKIAGDTSVTNNTTWATTDLAETQSNNAVATQIAPYQEEASIIASLSQIASLPGSTTSTSSKSNGFLGIGGGNKTVTTYTPNPSATSASSLLDELLNGGFSSMHG